MAAHATFRFHGELNDHLATAQRNRDVEKLFLLPASVKDMIESLGVRIRWYKLCSQAGAVPFGVCQQSTYSPDTTNYRWMGSIAQNSAGDLGLGYSEASSLLYPSIAVTGLNHATDTQMEPENVIYPGQNFQDTYSRWGDYSSIAVDPKDDCTF